MCLCECCVCECFLPTCNLVCLRALPDRIQLSAHKGMTAGLQMHLARVQLNARRATCDTSSPGDQQLHFDIGDPCCACVQSAAHPLSLPINVPLRPPALELVHSSVCVCVRVLMCANVLKGTCACALVADASKSANSCMCANVLEGTCACALIADAHEQLHLRAPARAIRTHCLPQDS